MGLAGLYGYYSDNEAILVRGLDAVPTNPALAAALEPNFEGLRVLARILATGWPVDARPGSILAGALGHAVHLATWRSLREVQGLSNGQAVRLMVGMVLAAIEAEQVSAAPQHPEAARQ